MLLEFGNLKLPGFAKGSGQPLTAAWLCFMLKYGCQAPIAANAAVGCSAKLVTLWVFGNTGASHILLLEQMRWPHNNLLNAKSLFETKLS